MRETLKEPMFQPRALPPAVRWIFAAGLSVAVLVPLLYLLVHLPATPGPWHRGTSVLMSGAQAAGALAGFWLLQVFPAATAWLCDWMFRTPGPRIGARYSDSQPGARAIRQITVWIEVVRLVAVVFLAQLAFGLTFHAVHHRWLPIDRFFAPEVCGLVATGVLVIVMAGRVAYRGARWAAEVQ